MIKLRALEPTDLDILYELENEQSLWASSNTHAPYSRFALEQFILSTQNDLFIDRQIRLVAIEDSTVVGIIDLCNFNPQHSRAEVSIAILKDYRSKGYGKETLKVITDYARQHLRIHQLYAIVSVENISAQGAFKASGFTQSGILKDWISMDRDNWTDAQLWQFLF